MANLYTDLYSDLDSSGIPNCGSDISPKEFNSKFVATNTPCFLPGYGKNMIAYEKWGDDEYMKSKIGDMTFDMEKRTRNSEFAYFMKGFRHNPMTYNEFITSQKNTDSLHQFYMAQTKIPDVLGKDLFIPNIIDDYLEL